jgi:hypothetical protein
MDVLTWAETYRHAAEDSRETSFSVAKSILSTLVGISIDQGLIGSVDDPIATYLPELAERDAGFTEISLGDLLTMRSGLRYQESADGDQLADVPALYCLSHVVRFGDHPHWIAPEHVHAAVLAESLYTPTVVDKRCPPPPRRIGHE